MMRMLTLLILLIFSPLLWAQDQPEPNTSDAASQKETPKKQDQSETTIWPKSFQPSQEIGADSQISFPTDI